MKTRTRSWTVLPLAGVGVIVLSLGTRAAVARGVRLPRVLIIGDSIASGYTPHVAATLKGEATVIYRGTGTTGHGLAALERWLGEGKWDVIHFNWGLHDLCYRHPKSKVYGKRDKVNGTIGTTLAQYEKNLDQLVVALKKTGAKLIWAHTTVVPEGEAGRFVGDDLKYNRVASGIMKKHGIAVNDLHALTEGFGKDLFSKAGDVHYTAVGSRRIGDQVAAAIRTALKGVRMPSFTKVLFTVQDRKAFLILPEDGKSGKASPWLWYAPTLPGLPGKHEKWMFERFLGNGMAVAGVDVGESYGSPKGRAVYSALYKELVDRRGLARRACLLARSRGGLMLYNWAVENPEKVACVAGIYPVCNIASYPGVKRACKAYGMAEEQLAAKLAEHNPIDRLARLAKAKVPIFHIHGDRDSVVPLDGNSGELKKRYEKLGGRMTLEVVEGQGHNLWPGWFHSQTLVDFVIKHALRNSPEKTNKTE